MIMTVGWTIVLDIGKTHSKSTLWNEFGVCMAQRSRPNLRLRTGNSLTLDVGGIERWLQEIWKEFARLGPVRSIIPVAHGAGVALIRKGILQFAPLDYEWPGAAADRATYDKQRDPFVATGSPALPAGLNLGMQLHWLESLRTADFRSGQILPWAQYWAWLLSGVPASELTSLGCHTDLWRPYDRQPSELSARRGWAERLAPLTPANTVLGTLEPEWVSATGLGRNVEVYCGMHDSNAALLAARSRPEIEGRDATVLSTGTWFVAMRTPARKSAPEAVDLAESRDCLLNVDVSGTPIPSSRFMGGREIEILAGTDLQPETLAARPELLSSAIKAIEMGDMIVPPCVPGVGPFPKGKSRAEARKPDANSRALAHVYAAMLADVSLDLIGSRDTLLVDGRFASVPVFVQTLANLRPAMQVFVGGDEHGVAHGALSLANVQMSKPQPLERVTPLPVDMSGYRARWREAAELAR